MNIAKQVVPAFFRGFLPVNFAGSRLARRYNSARKARFLQTSSRKLSNNSTTESPVLSKNLDYITKAVKKAGVLRQRSLLRWFIFTTFMSVHANFWNPWWDILAAGVGMYIVWEIAVPDYRALKDPAHYYTNWKIRLYTSLPWNFVSSLVGTLCSVTIPPSLREPIIGWYVRTYNCNMEEAENGALTAYPTFASFFNRELKSGLRPIDRSLLVSPADGTVLHFGELLDRRVEYVKGHDYSIDEFLGDHLKNVEPQPGNSLFQLVMYLAPGDYHAFHSPVPWKVTEKIHYPGHLLSVRPTVLSLIPKLFCINERVVLNGQWRHGFFSMSAVAATNVGDIVILNEPTANRKVLHTENYDLISETMRFHPGEKVGEFRMGSAIVLIFEAPSDIKFSITAGDHLRYGQSIV